MARALTYQGVVTSSELLPDPWLPDTIPGGRRGLPPCNTTNLPSYVRAKLEKSEQMLEGYSQLFSYVASTLEAKQFPSMSHLNEQREIVQSPEIKTYLRHGGTLAPVVLTCIDRAIQEDRYLGNCEFEAYDLGETRNMNECRNDHEFVFVRRQYCRVEGVPLNNRGLPIDS